MKDKVLCPFVPFFVLISISSTLLAQKSAQKPLKIYISVDMEGIGGIGAARMVRTKDKDFPLARKLMTDEVNTVVNAIFEYSDAEIVVNDSHGDMQNLLLSELDKRVQYIQSHVKPLGMVQGLDSTFDAAIFIGYHTRAGTENGFLAHTGSSAVKGLWINAIEVGEGGLNALFAGALGVPIILASGDLTFTKQFGQLVSSKMVVTKKSIGSSAAKLLHPDVVRKKLHKQTIAALKDLPNAKSLQVEEPTTLRIKVATTTRADIAMSIPGMKRIDGYTVESQVETMDQAYRLIRLIYRFIFW